MSWRIRKLYKDQGVKGQRFIPSIYRHTIWNPAPPLASPPPPPLCFRRSNKSSLSSSSSSHACRSLIWSENYNYGSKHRLEKTHKAEKTQKRRFHWNGTNHHQKKQKTEKEKKYRSGDQTTHLVSFCFVSVQRRPQAAAAAAICCIIASEALPQRTGTGRSKGPRRRTVSEVSRQRVSFQPWQGESFSFRGNRKWLVFFGGGARPGSIVSTHHTVQDRSRGRPSPPTPAGRQRPPSFQGQWEASIHGSVIESRERNPGDPPGGSTTPQNVPSPRVGQRMQINLRAVNWASANSWKQTKPQQKTGRLFFFLDPVFSKVHDWVFSSCWHFCAKSERKKN